MIPTVDKTDINALSALAYTLPMNARKLGTATILGIFLLVLSSFFMPSHVNATTSATFIFGGDVMLGRAVRDQIVKRGSNNGSWVTSGIASQFKAANLALVNLESPFAPGPALGYGMVFRADPKHVTALTGAGIDVVSFANNHSRNQGITGIKTTLDTLKKNNIAVAGAGLTGKSAFAPVYVNAGPYKVAVFAYTYDQHTTSDSTGATIAGFNTMELGRGIRAAKKQGYFVVVNMHAGTEYTLNVTAQQKNFAHSAINAGADLVVGEHPHWAQGVEIYRGKPILYSLGNLVFDQPWSLFTQQGVVAKITVTDGKVKKINLLPVKIDYASKPRFMTSQEAAPVLKRIGRPTGVINL